MARSSAHRESLPNQLRRLIADSGRSRYALGQAAGVDARQIDRFFNRERDLTLETAGKLAAALGAELVQRRGRAIGYPRVGTKEQAQDPPAGSLACGD